MTYPPQPDQPGNPQPGGPQSGQPDQQGPHEQGSNVQGPHGAPFPPNNPNNPPGPGQPGPGQPGPNPSGQWGYQQPSSGGFYPPPPPKAKTGLWIALSVAAVAVVALLITGFIAPGFFLGKDEPNAAPSPSSQSQSGAPQTPSSTPSSPQTGTSTPTESTGNEEYAIPVNTFLEKINAKDAAGAMASVCPDYQSKIKSRVDKSIAGNAQYKAEGLFQETPHFSNAYLTGSVNGQPLPEAPDPNGTMVSKGRIGSGNTSGSWCVNSFLTSVPEIDG